MRWTQVNLVSYQVHVDWLVSAAGLHQEFVGQDAIIRAILVVPLSDPTGLPVLIECLLQTCQDTHIIFTLSSTPVVYLRGTLLSLSLPRLTVCDQFVEPFQTTILKTALSTLSGTAFTEAYMHMHTQSECTHRDAAVSPMRVPKGLNKIIGKRQWCLRFCLADKASLYMPPKLHLDRSHLETGMPF